MRNAEGGGGMRRRAHRVSHSVHHGKVLKYLPGLLSAGSRELGRFVAATTRTRVRCRNPSMSVSSCATTRDSVDCASSRLGQSAS